MRRYCQLAGGGAYCVATRTACCKYIQHARVCRCDVTVKNRHPRTFYCWKCTPYFPISASNHILHGAAVAVADPAARWSSALWLVNHYLTTLSLLAPDSPPRDLPLTPPHCNDLASDCVTCRDVGGWLMIQFRSELFWRESTEHTLLYSDSCQYQV